MLLLLVIGTTGLTASAQSATGGTLAQASPPAYPFAAKAAGIEGKVKLKMVIEPDGRVTDIQVVSGPSELRAAAVSAVSCWIYHPYTGVDGRPTPTESTAIVTFTMGNKKQKARAMARAQAALAKQSRAPAQK